MASSDTLRVGKGELQAHAAQIRGQAADMDQAIQSCQTRVRALLDSWTGLSAGAYDDLFTQWYNSGRQCHEALMQIAQRVETSGQSFDEHDTALASKLRAL